MIKPYHLNPGEKLFCYGDLFGRNTCLCQVLAVHFPIAACPCCKNERMYVEYDVKVIDSEEGEKIGMERRINRGNTIASRFQDRATYWGMGFVDAPDNYVGPLVLIKRVDKPDYYDALETSRLIHLIFPSDYKSVIIPKSMLDKEARERLFDNYDKITKAMYGTIGCDGDGGKIKGWIFEFTDESLNFTI